MPTGGRSEGVRGCLISLDLCLYCLLSFEIGVYFALCEVWGIFVCLLGGVLVGFEDCGGLFCLRLTVGRIGLSDMWLVCLVCD